MRPTHRRNRPLTRAACALLVCLAVGWTLYGLFGHRLIAALYRRASPGIFHGLMKERNHIPLEDYYAEADRIMWASTVRIVAAFLVVAVLTVLVRRRLAARVALAAASLLLSHFLVFYLLERYPSLIALLHVQSIPYYAIKLCCVPDDTLVFRERPSASNAEYPQDRYSPVYMVDVPSIHMEWSSDENGFRHNHPAASADVVVIGDSYIAIGENEADTFGRRLQALSGLSVQNLGMGGYGPFQYLEVLRRYGLPKKPKYALFCFYEGNDIRDIRGYVTWKRTGRYNGRYFTARPFLSRYVTALTDEVEYVRGVGRTALQLARNKLHPPRIHPDVAVIELGHETHHVLFYHKADPRPADEILRSAEWRHLTGILADFKHLSEQHGAAPIIVYIPSMAHIYAEYSTEESGENWLKIRAQQVRAGGNMEEAMARISSELQMELVSLTPAFAAAAGEGKLLYYPFDAHWNSIGRDVAATFVASILSRRAAR
jgi:hypothetical protein